MELLQGVNSILVNDFGFLMETAGGWGRRAVVSWSSASLTDKVIADNKGPVREVGKWT